MKLRNGQLVVLRTTGLTVRGLRFSRWLALSRLAFFACSVWLNPWFAGLFGSSMLDKGHVFVERIVHRQVALRDGMCARGFVLMDQAVHVGAQQVFGVLVDIFFVHFLAEDGRAATRAATDTAAKKDLEDRDDHQHEAPTADVLPTHPRTKEARHEAINECANAADASAAFHARKHSCANPTSFLRLRIIPLLMLLHSHARANASTAACQDPVKDDHATQNTANNRIRCVRRGGAHPGHSGASDAHLRIRHFVRTCAAHCIGSALRSAVANILSSGGSFALDGTSHRHRAHEEDQSAPGSHARERLPDASFTT